VTPELLGLAARQARTAGCKKRWGNSWQITPGLRRDDGHGKKIDLAKIEAARRG